MEAIYLSPSIMDLVRTPAEKILLARVCQRASLTAGVCSDTNNELAQATAMHLKTVSDLIGRLVEADLVSTIVDKEQANRRNLMPRQDLLTDYPPITDSSVSTNEDYPSITDSASSEGREPYPSITDSPPRSAQQRRLKRLPRKCPMTDVDITHQRPDCRYASALTLEKLNRNQPQVFDQLTKRFLSADDKPSPYLLAERIRMLAKIDPVVLLQTYPTAYTVRACPVSGVDISHQRVQYPYVMDKTIKQLFKTNRIKFDELVNRLELPDQSDASMTDQCRRVCIELGRRILKHTRLIENSQ